MNGVYIVTGLILFFVLGIMIKNTFLTVKDLTVNDKRGFHPVSDTYRKNERVVRLPQRATQRSMAYDFFANANYIAKPGDVIKVWTDVKAYMPEDEGLIINIRSSMGGKWMLINQQGWIDSDYYSNKDNDGNIGFFLKNVSDDILEIRYNDRIGQGMFIQYLVADRDNPIKQTRQGGFGSTGE